METTEDGQNRDDLIIQQQREIEKEVSIWNAQIHP